MFLVGWNILPGTKYFVTLLKCALFTLVELAANTGAFAKSAAMLGNAEEHTALSRALSQLAEVSKIILIGVLLLYMIENDLKQ